MGLLGTGQAGFRRPSSVASVINSRFPTAHQ